MTEIKEINLNRVEVKLADTDDPVALKVSWDPKKPGGSNFKAQKIEESRDAIVISRSLGATLFYTIFAIPGLLAVVIGTPYMAMSEGLGGAFFMLVWGLIFGGVGIFMFWRSKPFTINKTRGVYFWGKPSKQVMLNDRMLQGHVDGIHAIQLVSERIRSSSNSGGSRTYTSYEMNLVFKDAERLNIMDHGKSSEVDRSALIIAAYLDVPIWKAQY